MLITTYSETLNHVEMSKRTNKDKFALTIKLNVDDNYSSLDYTDVVKAFSEIEQFAIKQFCSKPKQGEKNMNRIGETSIATNGMMMTIIAYRKAKDIDVQFEDGVIRKEVIYDNFKKGYVKNPHFPMYGKGEYKNFETQYAYTTPKGIITFTCTCKKCGWMKNLTFQELNNFNHECQ